jgi:hypothetical protein
MARNQNNVSEWSDMSTRGLILEKFEDTKEVIKGVIRGVIKGVIRGVIRGVTKGVIKWVIKGSLYDEGYS